MSFNTPILFLVFNRPNTTLRVFERIKALKPKYLFVAADGPRPYKDDENNLTEVVRKIATNVDWDCEVKTLFRTKNHGCGRAVSDAINWFFENVEEGIILEDDTIPDLSFFGYCEKLLNQYRNNEKVMPISGCYFFDDYESIQSYSSSYYFTKHIHVWGWATWRRAWDNYNFSMKNISLEKSTLTKYYGKYSNFWSQIYKDTRDGKIDTWDYQWMYAVYLNNGIAINPTVNLIQNIGFDENATHTKNPNSKYNSISTKAIDKIIHTNNLKVDERRDKLYYDKYLNIVIQNNSNLINMLQNLIKKIVGRYDNRDHKISFKELKRLKSMPRFTATETILFNKKFCIPDALTFLSSYYEIMEQEIYKFNSSDIAPLIIDCGANVGLATLYFKINYSAAKILAFEPDPNIFEALKNNVNVYNFNDVELYNVAIGHEKATLLFNLEGGHSGMLVEKATDKTVPVRVVSLKDVLAKFEQIDFLKIDIEGHEINVLPNIGRELEKVKNMFIEYHTFIDKPQQLSRIIRIIEDAGFRYYIKEAAHKKNPFIERGLFYRMDMLVNIFCYR